MPAQDSTQRRTDRFFVEGYEVGPGDFWRHLEQLARVRCPWRIGKARVTRWNLTPLGREVAEAIRAEGARR